MSTLGRVGVSVISPSEMPLDTAARIVRKVEQKLDAAPSRDAVAINGTVDTTRPKGAPLTQGITLAAGASINLEHKLGRAPLGFVAITMGGPVGVLQNDTGSLSADLQKKFLRVTNTGGAAVTFGIEAR